MREESAVLILCAIALVSLAGLNTNASSTKAVRQASTIIVRDDYSTIQEAINNAVDGDTVFVKTGIYYEHVVVNKTLSLVGEDVSATIIDGNDAGHVVNVVSDNVSISGFTVQNSGSIHVPELDAGICLNGTAGCTISGNRLVDNGFAGISLLNSDQNTITCNNVSSAGWGGVHLMNSTRNLVSVNVIADKYGGVNGHVSSNYNNITENVISNCTYGMFYHASNHNNIWGNNISAIAVEGIWLQDQVNYNLVAENNLINNTVAIRLEGPNYNNTLSRNVITGAGYGIKIQNSARYTRIADNVIVNNHASNDSWSAGIRLDSGLDSQIHSNTIAGNNYGVLLYSYSPRVSIYNNTITGNEFGIRVASGGSDYLNVSYNVVIDNRGYGIGLTGFGGTSNYATITRNLIVNNSDGIALGQNSNYNTVSHNNISMNNYGFYIEYSTQNSIYANNILNNTQQVYIASGLINSWDNGYPSGGNYWDDYNGTDLYGGAYQNETGSDGLGDSPYVIDDSNLDKYPLMDLWHYTLGDINFDGKVSLTDLVLLANAYGSKLGDAKWNPNADIDNNGTVGLSDLVALAQHYGQHYPMQSLMYIRNRKRGSCERLCEDVATGHGFESPHLLW
jgi:parallel beta-helix repeat protein